MFRKTLLRAQILSLLVIASAIKADVVPPNYVIYSLEEMKIGDRAGTDGNGLIGSGANLVLGIDARVNGSITVAGNATLYDRSYVYGNITAGSSVIRKAGVTVTGTVNQNTTVPSFSIPVKSFQTGNQNITIPMDSTLILNPGNYGTVEVKDRATLTLNSGVYNVAAFKMGHDTKLKLNFPATGCIEVNSAKELIFNDRTITSFQNDSNAYAVRFYSNGDSTVRIGYNSIIYGCITAPNASVIVHDWTTFVGKIYAKRIELQPTIFCIADTIFPQINIITPIAGSISSINKPRVLVKFSDNRSGLDLSTFRVYVNGNDRTSHFQVAFDSAAWQIPTHYALPDGNNIIRAEISDRSGNITQKNITFKVDTKIPNIVINSPSDGMVTNQNPIQVQWSVDGVEQTTETSQTLTEGENVITRSFTDAAGNTGSASVLVTLDTQGPIVVVSSPMEGFVTNQNTVAVSWTVDGVEQTTETSQVLIEGENVITRSFTDAAGNTGSASVLVTLDTQVPVVAITAPAEGYVTNHTPITVSWTVDGVEQTTEISQTLNEGENVITRSFTDAAGNTGSALVRVTLDTQASVVVISSPVGGFVTNQNTVAVSWTVDGVEQTSDTSQTLTEGENMITRSFTDAAGNTGSASVRVTLDTQAPVVAISSPVGGFITNQNTIAVNWTVDGVEQTTEISQTLAEGENVITRSFTDAAGNKFTRGWICNQSKYNCS